MIICLHLERIIIDHHKQGDVHHERKKVFSGDDALSERLSARAGLPVRRSADDRHVLHGVPRRLSAARAAVDPPMSAAGADFPLVSCRRKFAAGPAVGARLAVHGSVAGRAGVDAVQQSPLHDAHPLLQQSLCHRHDGRDRADAAGARERPAHARAVHSRSRRRPDRLRLRRSADAADVRSSGRVVLALYRHHVHDRYGAVELADGHVGNAAVHLHRLRRGASGDEHRYALYGHQPGARRLKARRTGQGSRSQQRRDGDDLRQHDRQCGQHRHADDPADEKDWLLARRSRGDRDGRLRRRADHAADHGHRRVHPC